MPWDRDVLIESHVERANKGTGSTIGTTGGHVWDAARRLADFLETEEDELKLRRPGLKVIELGAGCGWLGLTVAKNIPSATVLLTEMEEGGALEHLEYNMALNSATVDNVSTAACDWSLWQGHDSRMAVGGQPCTVAEQPRSLRDFHTIRETEWDLVIGSDLIYNDIGVEWLPRVLHDLVGHGATALYCHTKNRLPMCDVDFMAGLASLGLVCTEVREAGTSTPPPSPPPFESLFPEMRMMVLKITRAQAGQAGPVAAYSRPIFAAPDNDDADQD